MEQAGMDKVFLIDGFPRTADNKSSWNECMGGVTDLRAVLFFDADEQVMTERILKRSESSGRTDDNAEVLKKRFESFNAEQRPIIESYNDQCKRIVATLGVDEVYAEVKKCILENL